MLPDYWYSAEVVCVCVLLHHDLSKMLIEICMLSELALLKIKAENVLCSCLWCLLYLHNPDV